MDANTYDDELDIREQLIFEIMDLVAKEGLSFAFPSQSIYIESPTQEVTSKFRHKKDAALHLTEAPHRTKTMNSIAISPFAQSTINT